MAERKEYRVEIGGVAHTMLLSEADAERYGDKVTGVSKTGAKAAEPKNKARKPANKSASGSEK